MTEAVHMQRPEGEALKAYEEAKRLEREAGEAVQDYQLEEAERLRGLAKEAWKRFREVNG